MSKNLKWRRRSPVDQAPRVPLYPNDDTAIRDKKPEPPKESWWTRPDLTRAQFQERARRRTDL
jgi:hypothetical protein